MLKLNRLFMALCITLLLAGDSIAVADEIPDEATLIGVVQGNAGWLEKQEACRGLRQVGTAACIPALAALLPDKDLSHMARYALEAMPYPEAGKALRDALAKAEGAPKAGIVISLGVRRDPEAVPLLIVLLKDPDTDTARAALGALGRIATPDAAGALRAFEPTISEAMRPALAEGLLAAGQYLAQDGKGDFAVPIYEDLLAATWPMQIRMGAFRGQAFAEPGKAPQRLLAALSGDAPLFRDLAAEIVGETSGAETTKLYAEALPKLAPAGQAALARGLAVRKDLAGRPAVVQAMQSSDKGVKLAAVKALAVLGGASDVAVLAGFLAADDNDLVSAAATTLTALKGDTIDPAIAATFADAPAVARVKLLELLVNRHADQALPLAIKGLAESDVTVRVAGLRALAPLGDKEQVPLILAALPKADDASERAAIEKALNAIAARQGEDVLPLALSAMNGARPESRVVLLHVLARIGGPKPLDAVLAALKDADAAISDDAMHLLADWTTLDAAPQLLELAKSDDLNRQVLALRGYVRLAGTEPSPDQKARMLTTAMGLVKRADEKKLVLGAWGTVMTPQSLEVLAPYLDDAAVQNEAASAIAAVATELAKNPDLKTKATDALKAVVEKCSEPSIKDRAQKALAPLQS